MRIHRIVAVLAILRKFPEACTSLGRPRLRGHQRDGNINLKLHALVGVWTLWTGSVDNSSFSDTPGAKVPVLFPDDNLGRSTALTVTSSHRMAVLGKPGQTMLRSFLLLFFSSSM